MRSWSSCLAGPRARLPTSPGSRVPSRCPAGRDRITGFCLHQALLPVPATCPLPSEEGPGWTRTRSCWTHLPSFWIRLRPSEGSSFSSTHGILVSSLLTPCRPWSPRWRPPRTWGIQPALEEKPSLWAPEGFLEEAASELRPARVVRRSQQAREGRACRAEGTGWGRRRGPLGPGSS